MSTATQMAPVPKGTRWAGYVLSAIPALLVLMAAVMNLSHAEQAVKGAQDLGFPPEAVNVIGVLALLCVVLYVVPQTAVLGGLFMTAYFGAAVLVHIRQSQWAICAMPVAVCVITWAGLWLREPRLRALVPLRS
jgi:hypothetical protein